MKTTILKNEFWYGGAVYEGYRQPVGADDIVDWDFRENPTHNQIMPLFLSSKAATSGAMQVFTFLSEW